MHRLSHRVVALVPAWNGEAFVERTLASLAGQTYPHLRIVISDDASTDRTAAICARFLRGDRRFSLILQPRNLGWIGNSNFLLDTVDCDYLFFGFHDDLFAPTYVEELCARLDANPHAAVAFSDLRIAGPGEVCRLASYPGYDHLGDRIERAQKVIVREDDWWLPIHGLFRASAVRRVGGLRRHLAGEFSADWPWLVLLATCGEFERVPLPLCAKVLRSESVAAQWSFPPRFWYSVAGSCARAVLGAELSWYEKSVLWRELVTFCRARSQEARRNFRCCPTMT